MGRNSGVCVGVCVWKYSTEWEESMAIWQVLNLLAPTKEMPASGIHHYVLYTHKHTRTHIHCYYLLSVFCLCIKCWEHIIACCSSTYLVSPLQTLTSKIKIFTTDTTQ